MTEPGEGRREAVAKEVHRALSQHNAKGHNAAARIAFSTADRILAALEGAEPVAWTVAGSEDDVRPPAQDERIEDALEWDPEQPGVVSRRKGRAQSWAETREKMQGNSAVVALYRQSPEHGTTTVESAFLLTCGGCDRLELWATHPDIDDRGDCPECGRLDFDWQRILIPQGPEHGTGRGEPKEVWIDGFVIGQAYADEDVDPREIYDEQMAERRYSRRHHTNRQEGEDG